MDRERCYVCRTPLPVGYIYRRVMTTAHYTGGSVGGSAGIFSFTKAEVVSLCAACDAAEASRAVWRPGWGLKAVMAWCVVSFCVSAFLNGYWLLGTVCTSLVLWRLGVRWRRRRTTAAVPANISGRTGMTPPLLRERPCPGEDDD